MRKLRGKGLSCNVYIYAYDELLGMYLTAIPCIRTFSFTLFSSAAKRRRPCHDNFVTVPHMRQGNEIISRTFYVKL